MTKISQYLNSDLVFTPAVVGYLIKDDQVLLGLRKKVSFGLGENLISGIGGKIGDSADIKNETPSQALVREFKEEINVTPTVYQDLGQVRFIFPHQPKWHQLVRIYQITSWLGEPVETPVIKPLWFPQSELPQTKMWDDNHIWLPRILQGQKINMIFLYNESNKVEEFEYA